MVRKLNEKASSFDSDSDIKSLINTIYTMGDKSSDFIANVISSSMTELSIDKLTKSPYFSDNKKDIIEALDYLISKTSTILADCKYTKTMIKKAK